MGEGEGGRERGRYKGIEGERGWRERERGRHKEQGNRRKKREQTE